MTTYVYLFPEGDKDQKDLLGGKGANLAEMTNLGLPVPPGFTITTEACNAYIAAGNKLPDGVLDAARAALRTVEEQTGKSFGDAQRPLLVSVRSGAKFSMPGMMDTILNLGLNEKTLEGLIAATNDPRFGYDSWRRFIMMFGDIVMEIERKKFDSIFDTAKGRAGVESDSEMPAQALRDVAGEFLSLFKKEAGFEFPQDPMKQLEMAIEAVFRSWNNERAITYRKIERIPDDLGTAVNVQSMVFGNMGNDSGSGVAFTRSPVDGEKIVWGEYLRNAQGEDVVAGTRTPTPIAELKVQEPALYGQLEGIAQTLERHYRDVMDIEFTVEKGHLYMLQCRVGKRTARASVVAAVDMAREDVISKDEAVLRVEPARLDELLHPQLDSRATAVPVAGEVQHVAPGLGAKADMLFLRNRLLTVLSNAEWREMPEDEQADLLREARFFDLGRGLSASPGAASGIAVFDPDTAARLGHDGTHVILVRQETSPDDIHGMRAAQGVLTQRGGMSSHAALVARGFGIPCVAGCEDINVDEDVGKMAVAGLDIEDGQPITIDGSTGRVFLGSIPLADAQLFPELAEFLSWADKARRLKVRTNADTPDDSARAVEFGAEGIGLCRTEHMFLEQDRLPVVREMILAAARARASDDASAKADYLRALDKLMPMQQRDFEGIFRAMDGRPVTIRLIDPPMHEFLPDHESLLEDVTRLRITDPESEELREKDAMLKQVQVLRESNPMLGMRGCRLGIVYPEVNEMQVRAIFRAAIAVKKSGVEVEPEVMIPLVGFESELKRLRGLLERVAQETMKEAGVDVPYQFGTMIELPRAALTAGEIARDAEFFSFGTNDLTQTTLGLSRDDAEASFLGHYLDVGILTDNPFETIDPNGVGRLIRIAVEEGRRTRPDLKVGICGEHGGDPRSVIFCHEAGLDYVSCSPFRVPIARLAAAHAALADKASERDR